LYSKIDLVTFIGVLVTFIGVMCDLSGKSVNLCQ